MQSSESHDLLRDIVTLVQQLVYVSDRDLTAETPLADLGLDSIDIAEVGLDLEAIVGRELPDGAFASATTIGELAEWASGHCSPRPLSLAA